MFRERHIYYIRDHSFLQSYLLMISITGGKLQSDGQPFITPTGVTCREAGTA